MRTAEGRQRLAASLAAPLRSRLDYSSLARRILRVDLLPPGAAIYGKSTGRKGYSIRGDGKLVTIPARQSRIGVPTFDISSNQQIQVGSIRERRFQSIDRLQDLAFQEIRSIEERFALSVIDKASEESNIVISSLSLQDLMQAFSQIESHNLRVANVIINAQEYSRLRMISRNTGVLDENGNRELNTGLFASIYGARVLVSQRIPRGKIYVTAEPEFIGAMPISPDIVVFLTYSPRVLYVQFTEEAGFCCINPDSVTSLTIERGTG